jgi:ELP3 family radical SAM enzyme/protein acetyltransferase
MQIGIQHTNNMLLEIVNRGHTIEDSIKALKLLKDSGLKTICHLMPDLPFTTKELDIEMFNRILNDPDLLFDEGKIYPMVATDFTIVKKWADEGKYVSNADKDPNYLRDVIGHYMKNVKPWVRIPRIIRDIPNDYIHYGNKEGNLREVIDKNVKSQEIRGREIRSNKVTEYPVLIVDSFISSGATEYFIRYETRDRKYILGFCRLRLNNMVEANNPYLPELFNSAIIRELHVYGNKTVVGSKTKGVQHLGLGKQLVKNAEWIALKNGYSDICITSGIGVREYYKNKLGYHLEGMYMKKNIIYPMLIKYACVIGFIGMLITLYY